MAAQCYTDIISLPNARAIECFPEGEQLTDAQEQAEAEQQQEKHHHQKDDQTALRRTKRILSNARQVSLACDLYETEMIPQMALSKHIKRHHPWHFLTPTERTRFTHTYYRLWIFTTTGNVRHSEELRSSFLARLNYGELYCVREVGEWLTHIADRERLSRLGLIESNEEENMQGDGWYLAWVELTREWEKRMADLPAINVD